MITETEPEKNEPELIEKIEEFYLPRHLVKAIYQIGHIPAASQESKVGVGFIDIADYTHLSKFLSPKENQILLNGLYTAFKLVLERHGGFLNKIEGDSMMFHFDDILDRRLWDKDQAEREAVIARELFYTCIEMQRICILFNQAHIEFIDETASDEDRQALIASFDIIKSLRSKNDDVSSTLFAFFQIRIRIGANIGEVTIGNFGPEGSKHWDIIGLPVINAKRMEATAPIGGLRISSDFYDILERTGIAEDYYNQFRAEAEKLGSAYRDIKREELYKFRDVVIQEKHNATFQTYSVQVYPSLPESLSRQCEELLHHGEAGVYQILDFIRYYRGNHYVIDAIERALENQGVQFRRERLLAIIAPKQAKAKPDRKPSLFVILDYLDRYLDRLRESDHNFEKPDFLSYAQFVASMEKHITRANDQLNRNALKRNYFVRVIVQRVYASIEGSLREWQMLRDMVEEIDEIEEITDLDDAPGAADEGMAARL